MTIIWELDFYSIPILDEQGKKLWELLIIKAPMTTMVKTDDLFRFTKFCSNTQVNSMWLGEAINEAINQSKETPQKIRFFRRQMNNMITKACKDIGIPATPSRRTYTLQDWIELRNQKIYPADPNYSPSSTPLKAILETLTPIRLPAALMADRWTWVSLEAEVLMEMSQWSIDFAEAFPLLELPSITPTTPIPGLLIYSKTRALAIAGWMSGIDPVYWKVDNTGVPKLILETGGLDSYLISNFKTPLQQEQGQSFETAKKAAGGVHFIAIQTDEESESFAGFWLLRQL